MPMIPAFVTETGGLEFQEGLIYAVRASFKTRMKKKGQEIPVGPSQSSGHAPCMHTVCGFYNSHMSAFHKLVNTESSSY